MSLSVDSIAYAASAPKGVSKAFSLEPRAKALSKANRLRSSIADKAPQRASLPSSSSAKLALCNGAKGSSLNIDSIAYATSAPKDTPKVLSREARAEALFCANPLCGDKRSRTSSYVRSERASACLVGSEMCIRDSPRALPRFLAAKLELKHYSVLIPSA